MAWNLIPSIDITVAPEVHLNEPLQRVRDALAPTLGGRHIVIQSNVFFALPPSIAATSCERPHPLPETCAGPNTSGCVFLFIRISRSQRPSVVLLVSCVVLALDPLADSNIWGASRLFRTHGLLLPADVMVFRTSERQCKEPDVGKSGFGQLPKKPLLKGP